MLNVQRNCSCLVHYSQKGIVVVFCVSHQNFTIALCVEILSDCVSERLCLCLCMCRYLCLCLCPCLGVSVRVSVHVGVREREGTCVCVRVFMCVCVRARVRYSTSNLVVSHDSNISLKAHSQKRLIAILPHKSVAILSRKTHRKYPKRPVTIAKRDLSLVCGRDERLRDLSPRAFDKRDSSQMSKETCYYCQKRPTTSVWSGRAKAGTKPT